MQIKAKWTATAAILVGLGFAVPADSVHAATVISNLTTPSATNINPPPPPEGPAVEADVVMAESVSDPLEPINRVIFGLNEVVDFVILRPVNVVYRTIVPKPLRTGVANVVSNLASPVVLANDILQGEGERAGNTAKRFVINSTVGLGGLIDVAGRNGIPGHSEDFGQTLGTWGVGSGPYMVLPLLGPTTLRDTIAMPVDSAMDPMTWLLMDQKTAVRLAPLGTKILVYHDAVMDDVDNMRRNSADFYATIRDIHTQRRQSEIANGDLTMEPLPSISGE